MRRYWSQDVTPDRAELGEMIPRPVVEEVCQLLGHDPADVLGMLFTPDRLDVMATEPGNRRAVVLHRHVIR